MGACVTHPRPPVPQVYAFGITLWELFTGSTPYKGIPKAHLGHMITVGHKRPEFPMVTPSGYRWV